MKLQRLSLHIAVLAILLLVANPIWAQDYVTRLQSPATARGFIDGESHDSYVIHARKGQECRCKSHGDTSMTKSWVTIMLGSSGVICLTLTGMEESRSGESPTRVSAGLEQFASRAITTST